MGVGISVDMGMGLGDDPFDSSNGFVNDFFNSNLEAELVIQLASPLFLASAEKEATTKEDGEGFRKAAAAPFHSFFSMGGGDGDGAGENDDETASSGSEGRTIPSSSSSSSSSRAGSSLPPISSSESFQIDRKGRIRDGELDPLRD
jgi:hypothetical protein